MKKQKILTQIKRATLAGVVISAILSCILCMINNVKITTAANNNSKNIFKLQKGNNRGVVALDKQNYFTIGLKSLFATEINSDQLARDISTSMNIENIQINTVFGNQLFTLVLDINTWLPEIIKISKFLDVDVNSQFTRSYNTWELLLVSSEVGFLGGGFCGLLLLVLSLLYLLTPDNELYIAKHSSKNIVHNKNNFDFVRFLVASMVIISHSVPLTGNGIPYIKILLKNQVDLGTLCVDVFFIISGYLIVASYMRLNNIYKFLLFRVLRIFPALIVVVILTVFIIGPIVSNVSTFDYFHSFSTYNYLQNIFLFSIQDKLTGFDNHSLTDFHNTVNGALWTLPFEFTCYLITAVLGIYKLINKFTVLLIFTLSIFLNIYYPDAIHPSFFKLLSYFFAGGVFYIFKDEIIYNYKLLMISIVVIAVSVFYGRWFNIVLPLFGAYILFYFSLSKRIKLYNFGKYGDFSYGIYIYGFLIQQLVIMFFHGNMSNTLNYMISLPIAIILGALSFHVIETPFLKLKNLF